MVGSKRPFVEIDAVKLGITAAISAMVFVGGLAWTARGIVAAITIEQMQMEMRIRTEIESNYSGLAYRIVRIETRLGIQGETIRIPEDRTATPVDTVTQ